MHSLGINVPDGPYIRGWINDYSHFYKPANARYSAPNRLPSDEMGAPDIRALQAKAEKSA
jgi:hypothetical protein